MSRPPRIPRWSAALTVGVAAIASTGCALLVPPTFPLGTPVADVVQRLGPPSAEYRLTAADNDDAALRIDATGQAERRLEYTGGTFGVRTWMVDVDAQGRLLATAQVRRAPRFAAIRLGMTSDQVHKAIGLPSNVMTPALGRQHVWSYRYESIFCEWFQVGIGKDDGKVTEAGYGADPWCTAVEP